MGHRTGPAVKVHTCPAARQSAHHAGTRRLVVARLCNVRPQLFKRETARLQGPGYGEPKA